MGVNIFRGNQGGSIFENSMKSSEEHRGETKYHIMGSPQEVRRYPYAGGYNSYWGDPKAIIDRLLWNSSYFANMRDACKHNQTWSCEINRGRCRENQAHPNRHGFQANHGTGTYCQRNGRRSLENKSYVTQNYAGQHSHAGCSRTAEAVRVARPTPGTIIEIKGNQKYIYIRNRYYGDGVAPYNIWKANRAIEQYWSGIWADQNGGGIKVRAKVDAVNDQYDVNYARLNGATHRSYVIPGGSLAVRHIRMLLITPGLTRQVICLVFAITTLSIKMDIRLRYKGVSVISWKLLLLMRE